VLESGRPHHWEHPGPSGEVIEAFDYPFTDTDGSHLILKMDVDITGRRRAETELNKYRQHLEALVMERTSELRVANAQLEADIAERQQTEQALLNSKVRLNLALEVAELGEWELDTARNSTQRSLRHAQIFGYTSLESEWNMEKFMNHVLPEHRDGVGATLQSARAHGGIHDFETQIRRADGEVRWIWVRNCTHLAASGQVERIFGVILDTTERKAAEEVLRSKEARLRLALGAAKSGTWELDLRTGEAEWSDELWALYGLDPFSCVPSYEAWLSTVHLEDSERVQQEIKDAARNGTELDIDYRVPGTSGEIRWLAVRGQPILNEKMELVSYIGIVMDITERKLTEAALLSSEKLASVGRMAASIAHEINNPLAAVTNSMFLARLNAGSPDSVRKFLDMADDELKRVAHITRQTLGFYRETVSPISISVGSIMDSAIDVLRGKIKKIHPRIEKQYKGDLQVLAIPGELRQVFANLLLNSLDAIVQGGAITLRISPSQGTDSHNPHVRVTVADSGPGIDPATLPHIFEPLFTTKASTGTGLGLWVVSQILEKHGGTIRVRSSRREGASGTVFSILLPANANLDPNANA
jgi:PAS domain S-box-containing protein